MKRYSLAGLGTTWQLADGPHLENFSIKATAIGSHGFWPRGRLFGAKERGPKAPYFKLGGLVLVVCHIPHFQCGLCSTRGQMVRSRSTGLDSPGLSSRGHCISGSPCHCASLSVHLQLIHICDRKRE